MIPPTLKLYLVLASTLILFSCFSTKKDDLLSICNNSPELCLQFHNIVNCSYQRTSVIRALYHEKITPEKSNSYPILKALDIYESCLEPRLFMEFSKRKERKTQRFENYIETQRLIQEELIKSKGTDEPNLAYYLWSHYKDLDAKKVFLNEANNPDLKDIALLSRLGAFYYNRDPQKSLKLFYKILYLSTSIDEISDDIFSSIMNLYYTNKQFEYAYIWALILQKTESDEKCNIDLALILKQKAYYQQKKTKTKTKTKEMLKETAKRYYQLLEQGDFNLKVTFQPFK